MFVTIVGKTSQGIRKSTIAPWGTVKATKLAMTSAVPVLARRQNSGVFAAEAAGAGAEILGLDLQKRYPNCRRLIDLEDKTGMQQELQMQSERILPVCSGCRSPIAVKVWVQWYVRRASLLEASSRALADID